MKEVKCKLYTFKELSKEVKGEIVDKERWNVCYRVMEAYGDEYEGTLKAFKELMGIEVYNWSVDYCTYHFQFRFKDDGPLMGCWTGHELWAEDITGKLLRRYLNNNFMPYALSRKKFINYQAGYDDERRRWKKMRTSRIQWEEWNNCPLTGVCYDYEIMKPIVDCLAKPISKNYSLNDLVEDVLENFFSAWHKEYEYWGDEDSAIEEELENYYDGDLFFEDGRIFKGIYEETA